MVALPPLHADLGEHFQAILAIFSSAVEASQPQVLLSPPTVDVNNSPTTVSSASPIQHLTGFWMEHSAFFFFLEMSFPHWSHDFKSRPTFTLVAAGIPTFKAGNYCITPTHLKIHNPESKRWDDLHSFSVSERACSHFLKGNPRYSKLSSQ